MSDFYAFCPSPDADPATPRGDIARLTAFRFRPPSDRIAVAGSIAVTMGRRAGGASRIGRSKDGSWLGATGTWFHVGGIDSDDADALLARYLAVGASALARELEGVFALVISDSRTGELLSITDGCGSMHLYARIDRNGVALSSSALALSPAGRINPIALHEFLATGIIYEDRSLWEGVLKLPPASVIRFAAGRPIAEERYWRIEDIPFESLGLDDAVDALHTSLCAALRRIGKQFSLAVSDLTGGYDSRMLLCGLIDSRIAFSSTVSGPTGSADVIVASQLAKAFALPLHHSNPPQNPTADMFLRAVNMVDGEYDAFDFARILATHEPASRRDAISLNGSFGEVARGYWWELLWPYLGAARALDVSMVASRRFAAIPYDASIFADSARLDLVSHMGSVAARAIAPLRDAPNTSQMDALYLTLRMQRWQGRIASTTNQLWPAVSPLGFPSVLSVMLAARANTRFRSLLARKMFALHNTALAILPLEHGYPPSPLGLTNWWRFAPLAKHYGAKVATKLAARFSRASVQRALAPSASHRLGPVFSELPLVTWLRDPMLGRCGHLNERPFLKLLDADLPAGEHRFEQWKRLVTVEAALRRHASAIPDGEPEN